MAYRLPPTRGEVDSARRILGMRGLVERAAVMSAWKAALRISHPDAVEAGHKAHAEEQTKRINAAKTTLIEAIERGFPDGLSPATGRRAGGSASGSRSGPTPSQASPRPTSPRPPTTVRRAPSPAHAAPAGPTGNGGVHRVHVPSTPAWAPAEGRWLMVGALVVACLLAVAVVALTRQVDSGVDSRIASPRPSVPDSTPVTPVPTRPGVATDAAPGVAFGAEENAAAFLIRAHEDPVGEDWWFDLVHPRSRGQEVRQIIALLAGASVTDEMVMLASGSVVCDLGGGPSTGQSRCHVAQPDYLVDDLEFRKDGDGWKLVGLWHGPRRM